MTNLNKKFLKKLRRKLGLEWPNCPCCGKSLRKLRKLLKKAIKKLDNKEDLVKGLEQLND